jgi:O-methyltransferase involved in polyketide biosynthesis
MPDDRPVFDTRVANIARVYDYLLGGKDHFTADRQAAEAAMTTFPGIVQAVRANRAFLGRAARYLAGQAGIRQFLDIGTGIPTAGNTHEVAQSVAADCRIVYVDNDPVVLSHARALLTSSPQGATAYIDADLRDTGTILTEAAKTLDFSKPVAIMLLAVLHFIPDDREAQQIVSRLVNATAPGSFLVISHAASDIKAETMGEVIGQANQLVDQRTTLRSQDQVRSLFGALEVVEPGVVALHNWRPDSDTAAGNQSIGWSGVAQKR